MTKSLKNKLSKKSQYFVPTLKDEKVTKTQNLSENFFPPFLSTVNKLHKFFCQDKQYRLTVEICNSCFQTRTGK